MSKRWSTIRTRQISRLCKNRLNQLRDWMPWIMECMIWCGGWGNPKFYSSSPKMSMVATIFVRAINASRCPGNSCLLFPKYNNHFSHLTDAESAPTLLSIYPELLTVGNAHLWELLFLCVKQLSIPPWIWIFELCPPRSTLLGEWLCWVSIVGSRVTYPQRCSATRKQPTVWVYARYC